MENCPSATTVENALVYVRHESLHDLRENIHIASRNNIRMQIFRKTSLFVFLRSGQNLEQGASQHRQPSPPGRRAVLVFVPVVNQVDFRGDFFHARQIHS